jgi:hypothetical protein
MLRGKVAFETASNKHFSFLKSILAALIYTLGLPFLLLPGQHVFMKYVVKDCDHIGKVLAAVGIDVVNEKYVIS